MKISTIAYAAGIIDGEGYIDIYKATKNRNSKSPSLYVRVIIAQKNGLLMDWLIKNLGGRVQSSKSRQMYHWTITSKKAACLLKLTYPYLTVKKEQAKLAIELEDMKGGYLNTLKGTQKFRTLTEIEITERMDLKNKLKNLKKIYPIYTK